VPLIGAGFHSFDPSEERRNDRAAAVTARKHVRGKKAHTVYYKTVIVVTERLSVLLAILLEFFNLFSIPNDANDVERPRLPENRVGSGQEVSHFRGES
jgi:hypothetical protein